MTAGNNILIDKKVEDQGYPRKIEIKNSIYGNDVPIDLYNIIVKMKEGEIRGPIYSGPVWTIVKLIKKRTNKKLKKYDEIIAEIIDQIQPVIKDKQIEKLTEDLRIKYELKVNNDMLDSLYKCFEIKNGLGFFNKSKLNISPEDIIIKTNKDSYTIEFLIFMLNRSNAFIKTEKLSRKELNIVTNNIADRIVFYFDALEKGIDKIEIIKDKLINKEHRLLYSKFLKEEISKKVKINDDMAKEYYQKNRDEWTGDFKNVKHSLINELRKKLMYKLRDELVEKFKSEFEIRYNEPLLKELSTKFSLEKKNLKNALPAS